MKFGRFCWSTTVKLKGMHAYVRCTCLWYVSSQWRISWKNVLTLRAVWKTEKLIEIFYKNGIIYFTLDKRWEKIINEGWSKSNATQLWKLSILSE